MNLLASHNPKVHVKHAEVASSGKSKEEDEEHEENDKKQRPAAAEAEADADSGDLFQFLAGFGIRTVDHLLAFDEKELSRLSGHKWKLADVELLKGHFARQLATPATTLADQYDHSRFFKYKISCGEDAIDGLDSIWTEEMTEFCGSNSSGKTQLSLTLAAACVCAANVRAIYVDSSRNLSVERLNQIVSNRIKNCDDEREIEQSIRDALGRVECFEAFDASELGKLLTQVLEREEKTSLAVKPPLRLLVVDSISSIFASGLGGKRSNLCLSMMTRTAKLLRTLGRRLGVAIVVTNSTVADQHSALGLRPALGLTWSSIPHSRLLVKKIGDSQSRKVMLIKSGRRSLDKADGGIPFCINERGVVVL